jgi:UDPglucose 6-dehydrogenase
VAEAIERSRAAFFVPATPSLPDGSFNNEFLLRALGSAAETVRARSLERYLFVVNSTVTPGSCDHVFRPTLERILGKKCGEGFGLCYNPEFIALGNVIHGLLQPDFVLIGESDPLSGQQLEEIYRQFCVRPAPIRRMSNLNAELAKISVNCYVTMKISFANQLAALCAKLPGADPRIILEAIGEDQRIGKAYLKPGLGYGGPCFPRDNGLFQYTAAAAGAQAPLAEATDRVNQEVNQRLLKTVLAHHQGDSPIAVLGLAYKPDTGVIECSPGVWLCAQLATQGRRVLAHDYLAGPEAGRVLTNGSIKICSDPGEAFRAGCRIFVIACPWPSYRQLFLSAEAQGLDASTLVIDPWLVLGGLDSAALPLTHISSLVAAD